MQSSFLYWRITTIPRYYHKSTQHNYDLHRSSAKFLSLYALRNSLEDTQASLVSQGPLRETASSSIPAGW
eukprot:scaffold26_cov117-Cylindrotheca_fusiformis.AAC.3